MTNANTTFAALGFNSLLLFKSNGKKADGSPLFYRRPKDGKEGIEAGYRLVVPNNEAVSGLGAKMKSASGLDFIAAYVAIHGEEGEKTQYMQLRLFPNDRKTTDTQPVYRGFLESGNGDDAVRVADASGFLKQDKNGNPFLSVALQEPYVKPADEQAGAATESDPSDLDIPF